VGFLELLDDCQPMGARSLAAAARRAGRDPLAIGQCGVPVNVINNAGVNIPGLLDALSIGSIRTCLEVNCLAPVMIMQRALHAVAAAGFGRVISVTSGAPLNCFAGYSAYSVSKAALNAFAISSDREFSDRGVRINLMSPGPVRSNMAPDAPMDPSVCHATAEYLMDAAPDGPTGRFFWLGYEVPLFPDLDGIQWLEGRASDRFRRIP